MRPTSKFAWFPRLALGLLILAGGAIGCLQPGASCNPGDVSCSPAALALYNAPCHSRDWLTWFGSTADSTVPEGLVQTVDGGIAGVGRSRQSFGTPILPLLNPGTRSLLVFRYSEDGFLEWHTFLGDSGDRPTFIAQTGDGYVVAGTAISSFGTPLQPYLGAGANNIIVAKLSFDGTLQWHTYLGTALGAEETGGLMLSDAGEILVSGRATSVIANAGTVVSANTDGGTEQMLVVKLSATGTPVWQSYFGGAGNETARPIVAVSGGYVVGGESNAAFDASFTNQLNAFAGGAADDHVLVGFSTSGTYQWHAFYGTAGSGDAISTMSTYSDGTLLVGGRSTGNWGTPVGGHPLPGSNALNLFRVNTSGTVLWNTFIGDSVAGSQLGNAFLAPTTEDRLIFTGFTSGNFGVPTSGREYNFQQDVVVGSLESSTGRLLGHGFWGSANTEQASASASIRTCDNGIAVGGLGLTDFNSPPPIEAEGGSGVGRSFLLKLGPDDLP